MILMLPFPFWNFKVVNVHQIAKLLIQMSFVDCGADVRFAIKYCKSHMQLCMETRRFFGLHFLKNKSQNSFWKKKVVNRFGATT